MIFIFIIVSLGLFNIFISNKLLKFNNNKYLELEGEVKEYRKIKRKMNKWRYSQDKIIEILDNGLYRLKQLRLKRLEAKQKK